MQDADIIIEKINEVKLEDINQKICWKYKIHIIGNDVDTSYINDIKELAEMMLIRILKL